MSPAATSAPGGPTLGVDLGTTSVKVLALSRDGRTSAVGTWHHGIEDTAAGVQADPGAWWRSFLTALGSLGEEVELAAVRALGMSGNMSSVVLVDADATALAPALLLADPRGGEQLAALPAGLRDRIAAATGNLPAPVFALASLLWWNATDPGLLRRATAWLSGKDYLRARLTGVLATDATDAYNSLVLVPASGGGSTWDRQLIRELGLPDHLFPPVLASGEVAGRVTAAAAAATGLAVGTPVATGSGDVAASVTGAGGLGPRTVAVSLGTSTTVLAPLGAGPRPELASSAAGAVTVHPDAEGRWFALASLLTGGLALNWLRSVVGPAALLEAPAAPDPGDALLFLPYLAGTGTPDFVTAATGTVLGITAATTRGQLVGALLEAVCFDVARVVERLEAEGGTRYERVLLSGGGTRVTAWPTILADVLGRDVEVLDQADLSAVGAAVHGWQAIGEAVSPRLTSRTIVADEGSRGPWADRRRRYDAARRMVLEMTGRLADHAAGREAAP